MRAAVASLEFEGNSLSPRVAGREDFARFGILVGDEVLDVAAGRQLALSGGIETLRDAGVEIAPVYASRCVSGGHVEDAFFEEARDRIVEGIAAAMPLDGVYLALHGAMICATEKDPEGALLVAIRQRIGDAVPIAVSLDLHAHVTPRMAEAAQVIVGYETYPHVDAFRTGACAAGLLIRTMRGEIAPVTRIRKYNALIPVLGGATLDGEPMAEVAAHARRIEADGRALSVSFFPVQPWLDMADVGITGLAVADADPAAAEAAAQETLDEMWRRRRAFELPAMTPEEAVRAAMETDGRVLLIDAPDSMGAGAAGDAPAVLKAILDNAPEAGSAVYLVDAETALRARELGEGAEADFLVGAKLDTRWFEPVALRARVERLCDGRFVYEGGPAAGGAATMGPTAVLRVGNLRILAGSHAIYEHTDEHYRACGVDVSRLKLASFKNLMNYRKLLGPGVSHIAIHGPGGAPLRLQDVEWSHRVRPFWPADDMDPPAPL